MKTTLALALLLLTGCAGSRPASRPHPDERSLAGLIAPAVRPDSAALAPAPVVPAVVPPTHGLFRRLFPVNRQVADNERPDNSKPVSSHAQPVPKKCKGCSFYYGPATVTTIGKKAGPAVVASDAAHQNTAGANTQQTAVTGTGNQVDAKKADTTAEAPGFGGALGKPLGITLAVVAAVAALYFIAPLLIRRKAEKTLS